MIIKPLSKQTLKGATALADRVFPDDQRWWDKADWVFNLSLMQGLFPKLVLRLMGIKQCNYWVAVDEKEQVVLGVTGIFIRYDSPDVLWLGWFCVDPNVRGQGIGSELLNFVMDKVVKSGVSYFRLYTSDDESYKIAREMYKRRGFIQTHQEKELSKWKICTIIYYQLYLGQG